MSLKPYVYLLLRSKFIDVLDTRRLSSNSGKVFATHSWVCRLEFRQELIIVVWEKAPDSVVIGTVVSGTVSLR